MRKTILWTMLLVLAMALVACSGETGSNEPSDAEASNNNDEGNNAEEGGNPEEGEKAEGSENTGEKVTFRMGHNSAEDSLYHIPAQHFAELVEEKTNGTVIIDIYPGAQLGGARDMLENIRQGTLDMGWIETAVYDNITPVFNGLQLPFLAGSSENAYKFYESDLAQKILDSLEEQNINGLGLMPTNMRQFGVNTDLAIETPEDFEGLLIRAPENQMLLESFTQLGMDTTSLPYQEIYSAMQTGVIDGLDSPTTTWWTDGFYEVVDTLSILNAYPWPAIPTVNLDAFNGLSDEQQQAMVEAAEETYTYLLEVIEEETPKALEEMENAGVTIADNIDLQPFKEKMEPLYSEYQDQDPLVGKTIEFFRELEE